MGEDVRQPEDLDEARAQVAQLDHVIGMLLQLLKQRDVVLPESPEELELVLQPLLADSSGIQAEAKDLHADQALHDAVADGTLWGDEMGIYDGMQLMNATLPTTPPVGVKIRDMSYTVRKNARMSGVETVGSMVVKFFMALTCIPCFRVAICGMKFVSKKVLRNVNITIRPGMLTLVLGPPGCGKSCLLRAVRGDLPGGMGHSVTGEVLYNDQSPDSGAYVLPKLAAYVPQTDFHTALMTVTETFAFAFDCMEAGRHAAWLDKSEMTEEMQATLKMMDEKKAKVRVLIKVLGLVNAKDTIVGNAFVRGVSGGEKRRVSCGEMLVGSTSVLLLDSISNGLDSSTTHDIICALSRAAQTFNKTIAVALLQPPPLTFEVFQRLVLMAEGYIIFSGPTSEALPYFQSLGFFLPERKDVADWLVELPTSQGSQYIVSGHHPAPPGSAREFAMRWEQSALAEDERAELSAQMEMVPAWLPNQKVRFAGSWYYHFSVCLRKELALLKRDTSYTRTRVIVCLIMSLTIGSIFFQIDPYNFTSVMGVLFFALLFLTLGAMAELPSAIMSRAVFYKQYYQGFYPATAKLLAETAVASMETALEVVAFVPAVYFLVGFDYTASSFLTFLVILIGLNLAMTSIFKMFAALLPSFDTAQSIAGLVLILLVLFCGFLIQENSIPDVLIFIYWLNPLAWAFRAVAVNEFRSPSYDVCSVPNVPAGQPCPSGLTLSEQIFLTYDLRSDVSWIWTGLAFVYIFWFVMTVLTGVVLSNVRYHGANGEITEDDVKDEQGWVHETEDVAGGELGGGLPAPAPGAVSDVEASTLAAPEPATQCPTHMSSVCSQYHTSATADRESILATTESMDLDTPQFVPVTLTFEHINYSVPHPGGDGMLELLHDITGYAKPGTMTCLMGSSGAGKTTLLDVLAGRKTGGEITGSIKLNGHVKEAKSFARIAGYIEQFDAHSPAVTVEEAVQFSALMRLEESEWSPESRAAYVENILRMLELTPIASCVIGSDMAGGISMEQRKRTTIAVEMAANPSLLFLDEPTTGLDARSAQVVMRAVRMVAETQRTIICTIHQPSTYLFEMFDALLLLKKGGQTVFFGDLGPCSQSMISYFMSVPGCKPIADNGNAATWALEQIGAGTSSKVNPQTFADFYAISPLKDQHRQALVELTTPKQGSQPISFPHLYAASSATQYKGNLSRAFMQYWRSPNYNFSRMFLAVVQAIFLSCSYVGKDIETVGDAISIIGVIFMSATIMGVVFYQSSIPFYSAEREVFYREQAAGMYSVRPYAFGYFFAELPYLFLSTLIFVSIFYFMAGLDPQADKFFFYYLIYFLYISFMCFTGHAMTALMPTVKHAQSFGGVFNSVFTVFAGFLITPNIIPVYWLWAYYINPLHYALEGLVMFQFYDQTTPLLLANGSTIPLNEMVDAFFGGEFSKSNMWYDMMALIIFIVLIRVVYLYAAYYVRHISR